MAFGTTPIPLEPVVEPRRSRRCLDDCKSSETVSSQRGYQRLEPLQSCRSDRSQRANFNSSGLARKTRKRPLNYSCKEIVAKNWSGTSSMDYPNAEHNKRSKKQCKGHSSA